MTTTKKIKRGRARLRPKPKAMTPDVITPGKRCPVCELVILKPEPSWNYEYIDTPHADLKECMLIMIDDLKHTIYKLEDRISNVEHYTHYSEHE